MSRKETVLFVFLYSVIFLQGFFAATLVCIEFADKKLKPVIVEQGKTIHALQNYIEHMKKHQKKSGTGREIIIWEEI